MNGFFKTDYGYFSEHGDEYIITRFDTPRPWINVISNGRYGLTISQVGGGFSWIDHSNLNRLTRWNQDMIRDDWGKYFYLKDEESGHLWCPTVQPAGSRLDRYQCRHGIGYTRITGCHEEIECSIRVFVPFEMTFEIWSVQLKNLGNRSRRISIYTYLEWCLGAAPDHHREFHRTFISTSFRPEMNMLTADKVLWEVPAKRGHWNTEWPYTAFWACSQPVDDYDSAKESVIGQYGSFAAPAGFSRNRMARSTGRWHDAVASFKKEYDLSPHGSNETHFFLGVQTQAMEMDDPIRRLTTDGEVERLFNQTRQQWIDRLDTTRVDTPDQAMNLMMNRWLKYQAISGRIWGRAAYYQQSGAYGFRDQLQDSQIFLYLDPTLTRRQILLHARHQFSQGKVYHWWHPITEIGHDAGMSDDLLWLPFLVVQYLKETLDWSLLELEEPFCDTHQSAPILEHCLRAFDCVEKRMSPRGLPLILHGDWNDGLSAVGIEGRGESIWMAHFLYYLWNEFRPILLHCGRNDQADRMAGQADRLKTALNDYGWDGQWFRRGTKDNGEWFGSDANAEGKIFLNAQTWAVIAGTTDPERQHQAMQSVSRYLEKEIGPLLLYPGYRHPDPEIGYLSRYAPGIRENGGVYTHAATWMIWAAAALRDYDWAYRIFCKICPIHLGMNPQRYAAEPYVTPGNIDGPDSPHFGRGGWTWYTGSAAWLFRVCLDFLIGIRADYDGLRVEPGFPMEWNEVKVKRLFRGCIYHIRMIRIRSGMNSPLSIRIDGETVPGNLIPPVLNKKEVHVLIQIDSKD